MLLFVFSVVLVSWLVTKYILHTQRLEKFVKNVNTMSPALPLIGNNISHLSKSMTEFAQECFDFVKRNGSPFKFYAGPQLIIFCDNPEDVKTVLMSPQCVAKPYVYDFYPCPNSISGLKSKEAWKPIRKLLNPMFSMSNLQSHLPAIHRQSKLFVEDISDQVGAAEFDILHYAELCTLRCVCATTLRVDIDLHANGGVEFIHSTAAIFHIIPKRVMRPWLHFDFIYRWTSLYKEQQKHYAKLRYFTNRVCFRRSLMLTQLASASASCVSINDCLVFEEEVKAVLAAQKNNLADSSEFNPKSQQLPFIQAFLDGKLSEEMTKQQIEILLIAGFDTQGLAISYTILMIAMHPEIQEQLVTELRSIFQTQDEETTYAHILQLKLLERVIKESMRLFPIVISSPRVSDANIHISNCVIPKNNIVMLMYFSMHRRPEIWGDDANEFNPDHFYEENCRMRHPFAFLPFLAGPRNCLGHQQAMFTMKTVLSAALRNYKFTTKLKMRDLKLRFDIALKIENNHMV